MGRFLKNFGTDSRRSTLRLSRSACKHLEQRVASSRAIGSRARLDRGQDPALPPAVRPRARAPSAADRAWPASATAANSRERTAPTLRPLRLCRCPCVSRAASAGTLRRSQQRPGTSRRPAPSWRRSARGRAPSRNRPSRRRRRPRDLVVERVGKPGSGMGRLPAISASKCCQRIDCRSALRSQQAQARRVAAAAGDVHVDAEVLRRVCAPAAAGATRRQRTRPGDRLIVPDCVIADTAAAHGGHSPARESRSDPNQSGLRILTHGCPIAIYGGELAK